MRQDEGIPPYGAEQIQAVFFKTRRKKFSSFLLNWISGSHGTMYRRETQNLCPLNQWGQRFVI